MSDLFLSFPLAPSLHASEEEGRWNDSVPRLRQTYERARQTLTSALGLNLLSAVLGKETSGGGGGGPVSALARCFAASILWLCPFGFDGHSSFRPSPSDILQRICLAKFERPPPLFVETAVFIFVVRGRGRPFPLPPIATTSNPGLMDYAKLRSLRCRSSPSSRQRVSLPCPSTHPS